MNRIARVAAVVGLAMGGRLLAVPAASAEAKAPQDINIYINPHYYIKPRYISESGPGDQNYAEFNKSSHNTANNGNKPVKTGDIKQVVKGKKIGPATVEVEGPEQDVEAAEAQGAAAEAQGTAQEQEAAQAEGAAQGQGAAQAQQQEAAEAPGAAQQQEAAEAPGAAQQQEAAEAQSAAQEQGNAAAI